MRIPPFRTLADALTRTTEWLAAELARPTDAAPKWTELEWCVAEACAVLQGVSALLARSLRWSGAPHWQQFLAEQAHQTNLRARRIDELLGQIDAGLRNATIPAVALKGAALYRLGLYPGGERPMGDIDLLLRPEDVDAAAHALAPLGYRASVRTWRHLTLEPPPSGAESNFGEHIDNPIKLELHDAICERLPVKIVDITDGMWPRAAAAGLNAYASPAALMQHLLLHAAGNMRARALRHIQLYDVVSLARMFQADDWRELVDGAIGARGLWWALAPLRLAGRYWNDAVPATVLRRAAAGCPLLLRRASARQRLADVSWSKLRIQAFPGIEWCTSVAQAARFIGSRIWPSRVDLEELKAASRTLHYSTATRWYGESHLQRIARWIVSKPPRVQAMHAIQQSFAQRRPGP